MQSTAGKIGRGGGGDENGSGEESIIIAAVEMQDVIGTDSADSSVAVSAEGAYLLSMEIICHVASFFGRDKSLLNLCLAVGKSNARKIRHEYLRPRSSSRLGKESKNILRKRVDACSTAIGLLEASRQPQPPFFKDLGVTEDMLRGLSLEELVLLGIIKYSDVEQLVESRQRDNGEDVDGTNAGNTGSGDGIVGKRSGSKECTNHEDACADAAKKRQSDNEGDDDEYAKKRATLGHAYEIDYSKVPKENRTKMRHMAMYADAMEDM
mmetsp:Transcript_11353/g.23215  ORF Transcript_11353/g.23215 Transcript_11353/m.23215 type:complete len:266 (+) Transcript_11353:397-1194(+)|eukprot:CAMPEP_0178710766 /NCGR_PEP_ID=MMETSP0699-20121125/17957_1 /TAXON_ID=265572 /ORGANISM="Extubocellulus spinifer, Strain CCMP396" /LENGTH=265 /DNA_ID=CAMNT_0020359339 /DNA_START=390 /DNA_END=1187 /DNA_ORIENTATION=-